MTKKFSANQFDEVIRQALREIENPEAAAAFIFSKMNILQHHFSRQHSAIQQLQSQLAELQE